MILALCLLRLTAVAAASSILLGCSGPRQTAAGATAPPPPTGPAPAVSKSAGTTAPDSASWLVADSAARVVTLELEVTARPGAASALINGHRAGEARIIVPIGWTVKWNWRSVDSAATHSLVVMAQREKIPLAGGRAAFSNAMTRMVTEGLSAGQSDESTFVAEEAGWYWMLCGVPSHAINGEWLELRADPDARTARIELKKKRKR